jgi:hypothetical protein
MDELIKEETRIDLKADEAALVINEDGSSLQIILPNGDDDATTPLNVQLLSAIAILLKKDNTFADYVMNQFYTLLEEHTDWKTDEPEPGDIGC